jgi:hypothetical protein
MPAIKATLVKNKHLLWATTLCSLGCVPLGLGAMLAARQSAAEVTRLAAAVDRSQGDARILRDEFTALRSAVRDDRAALNAEIAGLRSRFDQLARTQTGIDQLCESLKPLGGLVHVLADKPWQGQIQHLEERLSSLERRLDDPTRPQNPSGPRTPR